MVTTEHTIAVGDTVVSALLDTPENPSFGYVLAHGAGAGMRHPFLASVASRLAARGAATVRYQFPYMEGKRGRVDSPDVAAAAVRAAVIKTAELLPGLPLVAGGKSFGGRMTSEAESRGHLPGVHGLAFLGFPLHPPGKPGVTRAAHLSNVDIPMLFLQGTRDEFATLELLTQVVSGLTPRATLELFEDGDHSFAVRKSSGRTNAQVLDALCDTLVAWAASVIPKR
ncbi:MAG: alpha/beta family hydrolase [Gemmatimonadaceae bacterium]